ncbi:MAG: hypothetical protein WC878_06175 [Candidatus Paceibacterota bacterium]|jgi:hypothetical protein
MNELTFYKAVSNCYDDEGNWCDVLYYSGEFLSDEAAVSTLALLATSIALKAGKIFFPRTGVELRIKKEITTSHVPDEEKFATVATIHVNISEKPEFCIIKRKK